MDEIEQAIVTSAMSHPGKLVTDVDVADRFPGRERDVIQSFNALLERGVLKRASPEGVSQITYRLIG